MVPRNGSHQLRFAANSGSRAAFGALPRIGRGRTLPYLESHASSVTSKLTQPHQAHPITLVRVMITRSRRVLYSYGRKSLRPPRLSNPFAFNTRDDDSHQTRTGLGPWCIVMSTRDGFGIAVAVGLLRSSENEYAEFLDFKMRKG